MELGYEPYLEEFLPLLDFDTNRYNKGDVVQLFKGRWGNSKKWFVNNTNIYFARQTMSLLKKDFEISKNIFITQADVREFQLAKAAVEASVKILSKKINSSIKKVCICGNLGKHLNIENAKFLRLIPDINDVVVSENAPLFSLKNSDKKLWKKIAESAQYIDISNDGDFEKIFEEFLKKCHVLRFFVVFICRRCVLKRILKNLQRKGKVLWFQSFFNCRGV